MWIVKSNYTTASNCTLHGFLAVMKSAKKPPFLPAFPLSQQTTFYHGKCQPINEREWVFSEWYTMKVWFEQSWKNQ